jgi:membrane protease YdiL (CAAX protease family)
VSDEPGATPPPIPGPPPSPPPLPTPPPATAPPPPEGVGFRTWLRGRVGGPLLCLGGTIAWFIGAQCVPGLVVGMWIFLREGRAIPGEEMESRIVAFLPTILILGAVASVVLVLALRVGGVLAPAPPPRHRGAAALAWTVLCTVLCLGGQVALSHLQSFAGFEVTEQEAIVESFRRGGAAIWIAFALAAPVAEELVFRRFVFSTLLASNGRVAAHVAAALLFAAAHLHPPAALNYVWIAVTCAVALERTGTVLAPMFVHAANNAIAVAASQAP